MLRLGLEKVIPFVLRTRDFMFFGIFMFSAARNFCSSAMFLVSFYSRTDVWEELDDYPEVIQSSFLTLKQSARTVLGFSVLGFVLR